MGSIPVQHPALGAVQATAHQVGDHPDGQVGETVLLMGGYVAEDVGVPEVIRAAHEAAAPGSPLPNIIAGVWDWVRGHVTFVNDQATALPLESQGIGTPQLPVVEVLIRPRDMVDQIRRRGSTIGDCDDFAMLTAALLGVHGVQSDFVTVAADPALESWSHVYLAADVGGGRRLAMDTSHGEWPGWESPADRRKAYWPAYRPVTPELVILSLVLIWWIGTGGMGEGDG